MTERRATITLSWRAPCPTVRQDDFVEANGDSIQLAPAAPKEEAGREVERRSIGRRLENWGMWANMGGRSGHGGSDCMTGVICENMRRNALGELHAPAPVNDRLDIPDAEAINRAITKIDEIHRWVLHWTYVVCAKPWGVAGACGFPTKEYGVRLGDAQAAIESAVGGVGSQRASSKLVDNRKTHQ